MLKAFELNHDTSSCLLAVPSLSC